MKNKYFIIYLFVFLWVMNNTLASEIVFEADDINILNNGDRIVGNKGVSYSADHDLKIQADSFDYSKSNSILTATKKAKATFAEKNIIINADKFIYNKNLSTLRAVGNTEIYDSANKILLISNQILYYINQNKIESLSHSKIKDELGNLFISKNFIYTLSDGLIKFDNLEFIDVEKNNSQIKKAYINVKSKKLIGKDISINFNNKGFNKDNDPRLKGNSISSNSENTLITKGIFTTCKKNDDCPPWQLTAKEIRHDKKKKIMYYKDAWLKIYDKPVFYFPKFFHPDPTVKRQSGFLMPAFTSSSNIGTSFNLPYFHVISENKDLTIQPRIYANEKLLLQAEYREANLDSKHTIDFSAFNGLKESNKGHLFLNSYKRLNLSYFDESELDITLEQVTNDTYLKAYKIQSPIINDDSLLESSMKVTALKESLSLDLELKVFEDLTKKKSDRYEYMLPNYTLIKEFDEVNNFDGIFSLNSSGHMKNYDTNVSEKVLINDFYFKSHSKFKDNGIKSNYTFLVKNTNTDGDNSLRYEKNPNHDLATLVEYNSTYPLKRVTNEYTNILKPKLSLRYSPNKTRNIRDEERRIDTNNVFSLNRIAKNDTLEGGASLTYGTQFLKKNPKGRDLLDISIANIIRAEENQKLPGNSSLGEKMSDVFGSINFNPNKIITTGYDFAKNNNLVDTNYEIFKGGLEINNFVTKFEYLNENNTQGRNSFLSNKTSYNVDDSNKLSFETRENKKTNLTEFYNLIYQYRNDCLIAAIEYNKDYYTDRDLKSSENIFFKLTIIPFGKTSSPDLMQ